MSPGVGLEEEGSDVIDSQNDHLLNFMCVYVGFVWLGRKIDYISMSIFTANFF